MISASDGLRRRCPFVKLGSPKRALPLKVDRGVGPPQSLLATDHGNRPGIPVRRQSRRRRSARLTLLMSKPSGSKAPPTHAR
jgi:hypothetical protein